MIDKAEAYIWATARVLEQRRFEVLFKDGDPAAVKAALEPYKTPTAATATRWSPTGAGRRASRRTSGPRWRRSRTPARPTRASATTSTTITAPDGGVPVALPTHGAVAARAVVAHRHRGHAARDRAAVRAARHARRRTRGWRGPRRSAGTRSTRSRRRTRTRSRPRSRSSTPRRDRARAERGGRAARRAGARAGPRRHAARGLLEGEIHHPHDFARRPDSLARAWFTDDEIERSLDHLESRAARRRRLADHVGACGLPAIEIEWSGLVTIAALKTLRAYGRI